MLNNLVGDDGFAKLFAHAEVVARDFKSARHRPYGFGGVRDDGTVHSLRDEQQDFFFASFHQQDGRASARKAQGRSIAAVVQYAVVHMDTWQAGIDKK